jgi:phage terminase small subunit
MGRSKTSTPPAGDTEKIPPPPAGLNKAWQAWWTSILTHWELLPHGLEILKQACQAGQLAQDAWDQVQREGLTVLDRFEQSKEHPGCAIWRHNSGLFARLVRELGLSEVPEPPRPPELY